MLCCWLCFVVVYFVNLGYDLTYQIAFCMTLLSLFILGQMKEIKNSSDRPQNAKIALKDQFINSILLIKKDKMILLLILCYGLFATAPATIYYYITNYWRECGISLSLITFFLSIENLAGIFAGAMVTKIMNKFSRIALLRWLPLAIITGMLTVPYFPLSIGGIALMAFVESLLYVGISTFLNDRVESQYRATLISTISMGYSML